jgi:transposase
MTQDIDRPPAIAAAAGHTADAPLPGEVAVLQHMMRELLATLRDTQHERDGLQQRLDLLLRKLYGPKAERLDPNQLLLFAEPLAAADTTLPPALPAEAVATEPAKAQRPGHGRKPLPRHLRREPVTYTLPEAQRLCPCCGGVQQQFGADVSEQLDYQPASLFIREHIRCKYACPKCHDGVTSAAKPPQPIDKGVPGPGLLAQIAVSKYTDHLPLHRLERIFGRQGVDLARSTMCGWMRDLADLVRPVVDTMLSLVLRSRVVHTDATKMPFQDVTVPGKIGSGQMWLYLGDRDHPCNVFDFCNDHSGKRIRSVLDNYRGFLSADAHNVYDSLFHKPGQPIVEAGCWAHCRRYFYDARDNDPVRAHEVLARIRRLYAIEDEAKKLVATQKLTDTAADALILQWRQQQSRLEVTALCHWLKEQQPVVLPKSLIGQAIQYALNHWQALTRFLEYGFLAIDNNAAENALRAIALGRKNWLFAGNERGGRTAATLFSLTATCRRHNVDAFAYLRDVIERLSRDPRPDVDTLRSLVPDRWRPPGSAPPPDTP